MVFGRKKILIHFVYSLFFFSCTHTPVNRAFYYWRTAFELSQSEKDAFLNLKINKLYIRFFDVVNGIGKLAIPAAPIRFVDAIPADIEVIPVVYIKNEVFQNFNKENIDSLAKNVALLIAQIASTQSIIYNEMQIDCDWTLTTKESYFEFLNAIKTHSKIKTLSATLRLHQIKFKEKTGVPPIDRGMLMFYNMGNINLENNRNSIFDEAVARQYSEYISHYSKPLDAVLPLFHWAIHGDANKRIKALIENISFQDLSDTLHFNNNGNNFYTAKTSYILHGNYFVKDDIIKFENVTYKTCSRAAGILHHEFREAPATMAFFASDSSYIIKYPKDELEKIFDRF